MFNAQLRLKAFHFLRRRYVDGLIVYLVGAVGHI
jgi:hypothetical protein